MKKIYIILILILTAGILEATDTLFYKITLLGMHCASVEVVEKPINENVTEIIYHAFTVGGFHNIYKIDNWYYYYTDPSFSHIDSLKKDISNRNMKQLYREDIYDNKIHYSTSQVLEIPKPVHHILTSLIYLQHYPENIRTGYEFPYLLTDEGDLYKHEIRVEKNKNKMQDEVYVKMTHLKGEEILEPTDVFNWMICAGKGNKMLAYSFKDHTITEGAFSLGWGLHLRAKRIYK
jgi:hypothetical protein